MSKIGNELKMVMLLKMKGKMKIAELARHLEVSDRQIKNYRNDLEQGCIFITSTTGVNGGYELSDKNSIVDVRLTDDEIFILDKINDEFKQCKNIYYGDFKYLIDKIKYAAKIASGYIYSDKVDFYSMGPMNNCDEEKEKLKYNKLKEANITKQRVKMKYKKPGQEPEDRIIHPYAFYTNKNDVYIVAYCEKRKDIREFKLCRILKCELLDDKFIMDPNFCWQKHSKNCIGIWKGEEIDIKLEITYPYAESIKEKIWSQNQSIMETKNNSIIFAAKVRESPELISWILGMGRHVKVLEPLNIRESVIKETQMIMDNNI